jgi:3-hydroxybutyryl-CoA dehydrogenase
MAYDAARPDLTVGVIGTGAMGRGIAQVTAAGGMQVLIADSRAGAAQEARDFIEKMLARAAEKGVVTRDEAVGAVNRIRIVGGPADMKPCHVVVEAIVENLQAKQELFAELEAIVAPDCILATNPLMKLVEVIDGLQTENWAGEALMTIGRRMTREPVRLKDAPGFLVNQVGRGYTLEAAHLVYEGVAGFADVDRIMRDVGGFRMGPFELMDLTALDVTQPASELIYQQFFHEPRYRPNLIMRSRYEAGVLGRKTKRGFYEYDGDMKPVVAAEPAPPAPYGGSVWVSPADLHGHEVLSGLLRKLGARLETGPAPGANALILVTPIGEDATTCAVEQKLDPRRTVAVDALFPLVKRRTIMGTPLTEKAWRDAAHGLLAADGIPVTVCRDSPGFIAQRIVAMIVNIGCSIAQSRTAQPADIDRAVTLGLNYPSGPFRFGDTLGAGRVHQVLSAMHRIYGDPRYRPSIWLTRRARLGVSLLTPEP